MDIRIFIRAILIMKEYNINLDLEEVRKIRIQNISKWEKEDLDFYSSFLMDPLGDFDEFSNNKLSYPGVHIDPISVSSLDTNGIDEDYNLFCKT